LQLVFVALLLVVLGLVEGSHQLVLLVGPNWFSIAAVRRSPCHAFLGEVGIAESSFLLVYLKISILILAMEEGSKGALFSDGLSVWCHVVADCIILQLKVDLAS
jgi:hypothetical protein